MMAKHSPAPWNVNPDYGKENAYRVWDKNSNYHRDTSPEAMDANARLISAAPDLLAALVVLVEHAQEKFPHFESPRGQRDIQKALDALAKVKKKP